MTLPTGRVAFRIQEAGHEAADGEGALEAGDNQVMVRSDLPKCPLGEQASLTVGWPAPLGTQYFPQTQAQLATPQRKAPIAGVGLSASDDDPVSEDLTLLTNDALPCFPSGILESSHFRLRPSLSPARQHDLTWHIL